MIQTKCKECGKISPTSDDICDACGSIEFIIVDSEGKEGTAKIKEIIGANAKPVEEEVKKETEKVDNKKEEPKKEEVKESEKDKKEDKKKK